MTTQDSFVPSLNGEALIPLNEEFQTHEPTEKNNSFCTLKVKVAYAAATIVVLCLGGVGLYFGLNQLPSFTNHIFTRTNGTQSLSCDYKFPTGRVPTPMPHQLILCKDTTYCNDNDFMLVSLYDYQQYMTNGLTLLTYENNGIDFSDIHSYSQGSYI
jgi:hypothetical protein